MKARDEPYDAIVVGSGITGGWAAKELCEKGLKTLVLERGRHVEHGKDYVTEWLQPWQLAHRGRGEQELYERDYPIQSKNSRSARRPGTFSSTIASIPISRPRISRSAGSEAISWAGAA